MLNLPRFSGKYLEWNSFYDQFKASVHNVQGIPTVQKLQHLLGTLDEPAKGIVKHLPITENSYQLAIDLLKQRYENKRAIFAHAVSQLLSFTPNQKETVAELQMLSAVLHETIQSIKNVGIDAEACDPLIAHLVIERLPTETRREFENSLKQSQEFPSTEIVNDQIQKSLRILELLESSEMAKLTDSHSKELNEKAKTVKSLHFTKGTLQNTSKLPSSDLNSNFEIKCVLCDLDHSIRNCSKFLEMPIIEKRAAVDRLKLCFDCLSSNHLKPRCLSRHNCIECGSRHHTLLHLPKSSNSNESALATPSQVVSTPTQEVSSSSPIATQDTIPSISKAIHTSNVATDTPIFRSTLLATAIVMVEAANGS